MATHHVLIDYENVQPKNLESLKGHPVKVMVFVGANQTKIPFDLADALQALGEKAEYIKISGTGRNALDFHIAFYLGELVDRDDTDTFHIISKDSGFDPLIRHLEARNVKTRRWQFLAELPFLRIPAEKSDDEKIDAIVRNLAGRGQSRPRRVKTLANTINALFSKELSETELQRLMELLQRRGRIRVQEGKVSYHLPDKPR